MPTSADLGSAIQNTADDKYRVHSVERALRILDILAAAGVDGASGTDIGRQLGVSKSTAFALLQTLRSADFVTDVGTGSGRRYRLGMGLARLGDQVVSETTIHDIAMPILRTLTEATGYTSRLAVLDEGYAIVIARVDSPGVVRFSTHLGRREFAHCSGVGKALLSSLPPDDVRSIVAATGTPRRTSHTITDIETLIEDLAIVRQRGYSVDDEEDADGVFCVGAPVFDFRGVCAGAISITGLKLEMPAWRIRELGQTVREHADRIAQLLGGPSHPEVKVPAPVGPHA
jgi:IclR family acetate operon transcriptional repressor